MLKQGDTELKEFDGRANVSGLVRWALYYKGEPYQLETRKLDDKGKPIVRTAYKGKTKVYENWAGGSALPILSFSKQDAGALRLEIHRKGKNGVVEVLWSQEVSGDIEVQWLVLSPFNPDKDLNKKLPIYIRGLRLTSDRHGIKEYIVMEGI